MKWRQKWYFLLKNVDINTLEYLNYYYPYQSMGFLIVITKDEIVTKG